MLVVHQRQQLRRNRGLSPSTNGLQRIRNVKQRHHGNQPAAFHAEVNAAADVPFIERSWTEHLRIHLAAGSQHRVTNHLGLEALHRASSKERPVMC